MSKFTLLVQVIGEKVEIKSDSFKALSFVGNLIEGSQENSFEEAVNNALKAYYSTPGRRVHTNLQRNKVERDAVVSYLNGETLCQAIEKIGTNKKIKITKSSLSRFWIGLKRAGIAPIKTP